MTIEKLYQLFIASSGISTDTREIKLDSLFFALTGENFNGNKFASKAIEKGAKYAIIDEEAFALDDNYILVDNVLLTLQGLANYHRTQFDIPVIGITGSNGKTTSKELIGEILKTKYNVLVTVGNLNNHLGVPFTLLNLNASHDMAIVEMGANKPGDILELVEIAEPTHGIITNIGTAHIEGFGSLTGVKNTKKELYDFIEKTKGILFYNEADSVLKSILPENIESIAYGSNQSYIHGDLIKLSPFVEFEWHTKSYDSPVVNTQLVGKYNFTNFLAAICIGHYFEVSNESINSALANYKPSNNRSQVTKTSRNTLIVDCYNANPSSMSSAIDSFIDIESDRKVLILGDMLELGDISVSEHQAVVDRLKLFDYTVFLVGKEFKTVKTVYPCFDSVNDLMTENRMKNIDQSLILLKGSRGIKLEKLIECL